MYLNWRQRLEQSPHYYDLTTWSVPCVPASRAARKAFWRNKTIVYDVLEGQPLSHVARRFQLSKGRITQLMNRCLAGEHSQTPPLGLGWLRYARCKQAQRRAPLPEQAKQSGSNCAFTALLDTHPTLKADMDRMIEARLKDKPYAQVLSPRAMFGEFTRSLAASHWPKTRYPYTSPSIASESVRRYLKCREIELRLEQEVSQTKVIEKVKATSRHARVLQRIQIDAHTIDLHNSVHPMLDEQFIPLRLSRATVLVAIEVETRCILGFCLVPTAHPNQDAMLTLIHRCLTPFTPNTPSLSCLQYAPGSTFPSGLYQEIPLTFSIVQLDNALAHYAHSVTDILCKQMCATVHYGFPGTPTVRALVEGAFNTVTRATSKRFAATTGAHTQDIQRETRKNQKRPPLLTFQLFEEALSVTLANENVTPSARLGGSSPLELYVHLARQQMLPYVDPSTYHQWDPFRQTMRLPIHWYRHQHRAPHVNYMYARYHGAALTTALSAGQRDVQVVLNRRDARFFKAVSDRGEALGKLVIENPWRRFAHSIATRQYIHKQTKALRIAREDPLSGLMHHLLTHRETPKIASHLLRVYQEFSEDFQKPVALDQSGAVEGTSSNQPTFSWSAQKALHRSKLTDEP